MVAETDLESGVGVDAGFCRWLRTIAEHLLTAYQMLGGLHPLDVAFPNQHLHAFRHLLVNNKPRNGEAWDRARPRIPIH